MRAKKARLLRQEALRHATFGDKRMLLRDLLETKVHIKRYPWLYKEDPLTKMVVDAGVRQVCTLVNNAASVRGIYLGLKKSA